MENKTQAQWVNLDACWNVFAYELLFEKVKLKINTFLNFQKYLTMIYVLEKWKYL